MTTSDQSASAGLTPQGKRVPTEFIWQVYADATLAGAAKLIPIPVADLIVEEYFRRRMPRDIAWYNGRVLPKDILSKVNRRRRSGNILVGCLLLPFRLIFYLFRDILRTVLYALTVADAAQNLGYYWHRAFLLNYAIGLGHLDDPHTTDMALTSIEQTISGVTTSPILQLAQQVTNIWEQQLVRLRTYIRFARNKVESERVIEAKDAMATAWGNYRDYWLLIADNYDKAYLSLKLGEELRVNLQSAIQSEDIS